MKRDKSFYYVLLTVLFVVTYIISYILSCRTVEIGAIAATAGVIIYPLTYFLSSLIYERYGKDKLLNILYFSLAGLIFTAILITIASLLPVYEGKDGLNALFNIDFRKFFGYLLAFYVGQFLNYVLYNYLEYKKWLNFLMSATISITADSLLFILLGYIGTISFKDVVIMFAGQYVLSVTLVIIYSIIFYNLIETVNNLEKDDAIITEKIFDEDYEKDLSKSNERKFIEPETKKKTVRKTASTSKKSSSSTAKKSTTKATATNKPVSSTKTTSTKKVSNKSTTKKEA